jgi:hypothetical protein
MNAAKEANRKQKLKLVSGYASSGLATKEFCKLHNLPEYIFYYWLKQVRNKKPSPVVKEINNFVPLKLKKEEPKLSTSPTVELVCPNGITLKFYSPVSFSELRSLIK